MRYHFSAQGPLLRTSAWGELPDALRDAKLINAAVLLDRWGRDINADNALELLVRPLFTGLLPATAPGEFS